MPRRPPQPLYRPVLKDAFHIAWKEKRYWLIALLASLMLSGSLYDVIWRLLNSLAPPGSLLSTFGPLWSQAVTTWSGFTPGDTIIGSLKVLQISALTLILLFAVVGASVIAQGALVYAVGSRRRDQMPAVREAVTVGARAFWPIFVLNLFALSVLWATRALIAMALSGAVLQTTTLSYLGYLFAFLTFGVISAAVVVIQIFALNAMILQGATLAEAIERGAQLLSRHWVVVVETAAILFVLSVGAWVLTVTVNLVLGLPLFVLLVLATIFESNLLLMTALYLAIAIFLLSVLAIVGFLVELQYATWTQLYRRLGEGGVAPKLHRWFRMLTHGYRVPGA